MQQRFLGDTSSGRPIIASQLDAVVADLVRQIDAGVTLDCAALKRAHPELMPELEQHLHDLQLVSAAKRRVCGTAPDGKDGDPLGDLLEEELNVLRKALDNYEVLERLRQGGQGVVYRVRQRRTNRIVALKVLLDGPLASRRQRCRFECEIELVSRLQHPGIVTVYDSGIVRGRPFYAMEFIDGRPINDYVILNDLTPPEIVRLMVRVSRAIHYAHQNGVIHRDLTPANILVDDQGNPHVMDFGLAKDAWNTDAGHSYSVTGQIIGTMPYLSPEQSGGLDGKIDVRSDVYSLGVILYELLTDVFPYPVDGESQVVRNAIISEGPMPLRKAIATSAPDRAPGLELIDRDLEAILANALAKSKAERYQSAADFAHDLERWLARDAIKARAGSRLYVLRKAVRKHRLPLAAAAVVLAVFAVSSVAVTAAWLHALTQRDNALRAANEAFDQFDLALTEVEDAVRPLAGGVAVRDRLVRRLSDELPRLEALLESDDALDPIRTRLHEKQGDIALAQGHREEAGEHYQSFLDDSLRLAESEPEHAIFAQLIRAYRKHSTVVDDPVPLLERGVERGQEMLDGDPKWADVRYELCRLRLSLGEHLRNSGWHERALEQYEQAHGLCTLNAQDTASDVRWLRTTAEALSGKGLALHSLGDGTGSREATERAVRLREQTVARNPANVDARLALLRSHIHLGTLDRDDGQIEDAKRHLRAAAEHGELLADMDPSCVTWDRDRYALHHKLASLCLDTKELEEARTQCEKALAIAEERMLRDNSDEARSTLSYTFMLRGKVQMAEGEWSAGYRSVEQALSIRELLLKRVPGNPRRIAAVAATHDWLAHCSRKLEDLPLLLKHRQLACEFQSRLATLQPGVVEFALNLARAQVNLASAHMRLRTTDDDESARRLLERAETSLGELEANGKLLGWERKYAALLRAIRANQQILQQRCVERLSTQDAVPIRGKTTPARERD